jgi:hypothetical protein
MAASAWRVYDLFKQDLGLEGHNLNASDVVICVLCASTSNAATLTVAGAPNGVYASLTNELATQFGYTQKAETVAATWADNASGNTTKFDTVDPAWTASGGTITAYYAVLLNDTHTSDGLICYCLLDATPADVSVTTGNTLTIQQNASGVLTLGGGVA